MPWIARIALLATGFGIAKFTETQLYKDMTDIVKSGSRQVKKDFEKEVENLKTKMDKKTV